MTRNEAEEILKNTDKNMSSDILMTYPRRHRRNF